MTTTTLVAGESGWGPKGHDATLSDPRLRLHQGLRLA
jgi:hypothetical protein